MSYFVLYLIPAGVLSFAVILFYRGKCMKVSNGFAFQAVELLERMSKDPKVSSPAAHYMHAQYKDFSSVTMPLLIPVVFCYALVKTFVFGEKTKLRPQDDVFTTAEYRHFLDKLMLMSVSRFPILWGIGILVTIAFAAVSLMIFFVIMMASLLLLTCFKSRGLKSLLVHYSNSLKVSAIKVMGF